MRNKNVLNLKRSLPCMVRFKTRISRFVQVYQRVFWLVIIELVTEEFVQSLETHSRA